MPDVRHHKNYKKSKKHKKKKKKARPPEEPLSEKELEEKRKGVMKHPAFADEKTRQKIIFGDVKRPTEYDKDIVQESDNTEVVEKAQFAYLARETDYIRRHLERLAEEKIEGDVAEWYKRAERAFTHRLKPIQGIYKDVESILARRLPNLREDFKAGFKKLFSEAGRCNIERAKWFGALPVKPIRDFRSAAAEFHKTIYAIFEESLIALDKLTKRASEQRLDIRPDEADNEQQNGKAGDNTKMSLREFLEKCTDVDFKVIDSKIKRIKAVNKKKELLPKTANKPKGNQTKLYFKKRLISVWSKLKDAIPTLPNIKK